MKNSKSLIKKYKDQVIQLTGKVSTLNSKLQSDDSNHKLDKELELLNLKSNEVSNLFKQLENAEIEFWDEVKAEFEDSFSQLKKSYEKFVNRIKSSDKTRNLIHEIDA